MGIDKHMSTGPFQLEPCTGYRATYSEVLRYLANRDRVGTTSNKNMHSNSEIPSHILQNVVRITMFESFAGDVPISSFRPTLPNLQGVTVIMPRLYPRELQNLVSKKRPERWVDKLVNKGYRWMLQECPDTIDRMTFLTVKNFDCLTCFGEVTRLHAVGISVTVSTSSWTVLQISTKKGTFKDRERESHQTSRKKQEKLPESWEGYECQCDCDGMAAWWLGLDVDGKGDVKNGGNGNCGRQGAAESGRDYLDELRDSDW